MSDREDADVLMDSANEEVDELESPIGLNRKYLLLDRWQWRWWRCGKDGLTDLFMLSLFGVI